MERGGTSIPLSPPAWTAWQPPSVPSHSETPAVTHTYCATRGALGQPHRWQRFGDRSRQARQWSAAQRAFPPLSRRPSRSRPAPAGLLGRSSSRRCGGAGRWLCLGGCGAAAGYCPGCQCSLLSSSFSGPTMPTSLNSVSVSGAGHKKWGNYALT